MPPVDPLAGDPAARPAPLASPLPSGLAAALADRYRVERSLGAGGMATVYLAEDVRHRRKVAVKVLHPELSAVLGPERFLKEIELTAGLQHPHILPLFDSGSADGQLYYVMPYVDGETLRARLERERQLPVPDALRIATEVADALQYAHARGVVHRDVKPENVLVQGGHALVADFGIALAVQQAGGQRMTQTGLSLGTPHYMAPEQALGERTVDARADVYALGAVLYEMLAGEPPITGPTAQAIVARMLSERPRPLSALRDTVPPHVAAAVDTALAKLPADRFASAAAFAGALGAPETAVRAPRERRERRERRLTIAVLTAGVVALVAAPAAVVGWTRALRGTDAERVAGGVRPWLSTIPFPDSAPPNGSIALSPDASTLVFSTRPPGEGRRLWVRHADALDPRPLAGTESARVPAISPDGRRVAFRVGSALRVVPLAGGPVTTVTDSLNTVAPIAWGDDGHVLHSARGGIVRIPVGGGAWEGLTALDTAGGEVFHTDPSPLPGSRAILFTAILRNYGDNSRFAIAVTDPATGRHRALVPGYSARYVAPGHLLVVRADSALVAVPFDATKRQVTGPAVVLATGLTVEDTALPQLAVASAGPLVYAVGGTATARVTLARVRPDGAATLVDSAWRGQVRGIAASPDGTHAALSLSPGTRDLQVRDLRSGALSRVSVPAAVTGDPVFTHDGKAVLFIADSPRGGQLYEATLGSSTPPRLVMRDTTMNFSEPAPSPDGRTVYYVRGRGGAGDVYAHALDRPDAPDRAVVATPEAEKSPRPSPDGRWLAYASTDGSMRFEIFVRSTDLSRAERWQVSVDGGVLPRWSPDGRMLFYLAGDGLTAVEVETAGEFGVRGRRALFPLTRFAGGDGAYDVLPGGGFLMLERLDEAAAPRRLVLVDRWQALLAAARMRR